MKNQLLVSALKALVIVVGVIIFCFVIFVPPRFVFLHATTAASPEGRQHETKVLVNNLLWPGRYPPSLGGFYVFAIAGSGSILIWRRGYETAEIEVGRRGEIFRGSIIHHSLLTIFHSVYVDLVPVDKKVQIDTYEGSLTTEGKNAPEVLVIDPAYRSGHMPLKWLLRDYANQGKDISALSYVMLQSRRDNSGNGGHYILDFSHANGGVQEFVPPQNWPMGNCYSRMLYSLNGEAPLAEYKKSLSLPSNQAFTPYKMGHILFYCIIDGHYAAGVVGISSPGHIKIWVNAKKGDQTLRGIN